MRILFLTGNEHKLREAQEILTEHEVVGKSVELPEIQSLDPEEIIMEKLAAAVAMVREEGAFMVEDVSFLLGETGFPGPLFKFMYEALGREGIVTVAQALGAERARAECHIGLLLPGERPRFFAGAVEGRIVAPRGESGFGFDPILLPDGEERTFAEMAPEEKNRVSHRRKALAAVAAQLKAKI